MCREKKHSWGILSLRFFRCKQPRPRSALSSSKNRGFALSAANKDLVERNVDELDEIADSTHDQETNTNGLGDFDELTAIRLLGLVDELDAVLEKLAGHVEDLLHLVRHCELFVLGIG